MGLPRVYEMLMAQLIEHRLTTVLRPSLLEIINQSHLHNHHVGSPQTGQSHFHIIIQSVLLQGLSPVQQHRQIYQALGDAFDQGLHAISIEIKS